MDIERLAVQNPWWTDKKAIEKDSKVRKVIETGRKIEFKIDNENKVLIGPRQLGKTTAFKFDIYKKIIRDGVPPESIMYFSFDTARNYEEISDVISTFVKG
ncbi:AAA ATPase, partial [mine drainage metagenome]